MATTVMTNPIIGGGEIFYNNKPRKLSGFKIENVKYCPAGAYRATVYDNKIYVCHIAYTGSSNMGIYVFDGDEWVKISTPSAPEGETFGVVPYNLCVCNGELWAICRCESGSSFYVGFSKLTQSGWTPVHKTNNAVYNGPVVAYNNEIHLLGYEKYAYHYKWDGNTLSSVGNIPYGNWVSRVGTEGASAVVYNGEIHLLGGNEEYNSEMSSYVSTYYNHYKYDGSKWSSVGKNLPRALKDGTAIVHDGKIHIFGGTKYSNGDTSNVSHYAWDGVTWTKIDKVEIATEDSGKSIPSFEFNGEIRAIGRNGAQYCWCDDKYWVYERDSVLPGLITLPFFED